MSSSSSAHIFLSSPREKKKNPPPGIIISRPCARARTRHPKTTPVRVSRAHAGTPTRQKSELSRSRSAREQTRAFLHGDRESERASERARLAVSVMCARLAARRASERARRRSVAARDRENDRRHLSRGRKTHTLTDPRPRIFFAVFIGVGVAFSYYSTNLLVWGRFDGPPPCVRPPRVEKRPRPRPLETCRKRVRRTRRPLARLSTVLRAPISPARCRNAQSDRAHLFPTATTIVSSQVSTLDNTMDSLLGAPKKESMSMRRLKASYGAKGCADDI